MRLIHIVVVLEVSVDGSLVQREVDRGTLRDIFIPGYSTGVGAINDAHSIVVSRGLSCIDVVFHVVVRWT